FVLRANVGNVEHAVLAHPTKLWCINTDLGTEDRYGTKMSPRYHNIPLMESQYRVINPTNPSGALDDGVEDRLHIRRRAVDDAEHLGGCGLMLQGLAQFSVTLLNLLEQPHVLDSDHRLGGESLEERDMFLREGTDFCAPNRNSPDRNILTQ